MHEEIKELRKLEAQMKEIAEHITEDRTMIENMAYEVSENCKSAIVSQHFLTVIVKVQGLSASLSGIISRHK